MTVTDAASLPALDDAYRVDAGSVAAFARDGHVTLRGVATAEEVAAYRTVIGDAVDRFKDEDRPLDERDTYGRAFLQVENLWVRDDAVARFTKARRFARIAAALLQCDAVRLYHDQALYKEPGGGVTPWHQDRYYWPLDTDKTITMWMPLVDVPAGMEFVSGSPAHGDLGRFEISDESEAYFDRVVTELRLQRHAVRNLRAGDATFHTGWMLHRAPGNQSDLMREVMTVIYFADGTRIGGVDSPHRQDDLRKWLPGCGDGELAASEINPVLWRRQDG